MRLVRVGAVNAYANSYLVDMEKARVRGRAEYRCWQCGHAWVSSPGIQNCQQCPRCSHIFFDWTNYATLFPREPVR